MLAFVIASTIVATSDPVHQEAASLKTEQTRYCREMGSAASRNQAIKVCRTRAQWLRMKACNDSTTYCAPAKRLASASLGRETAFPMNEDSRIICRRLRATGTRLTSQRTCMPLREWQRMWDESRSTMSVLQDRHSTQADIFGPR